MHEYAVEFRIHGHDLDVTNVTHQLGLEPSLVRFVGERRDEATEWDEAMWSYNGSPEAEGSKTWVSLEDGLSFILEKLWPHRQTIDSYKENYKVMLWCGHFQSSMDGGPTLSPGMLEKLGDFGVELYIDNYFSDDSIEKVESP